MISSKYFSVLHMNGPLYSRPLNCISMCFNWAYQGFLKVEVVDSEAVNKTICPASTNQITAFCSPKLQTFTPSSSPTHHLSHTPIPQTAFTRCVIHCRILFRRSLFKLSLLRLKRGETIIEAPRVTGKNHRFFTWKEMVHMLPSGVFQVGHSGPKVKKKTVY